MLDFMAGQNHHLNRTVLDESKPRVPVYPPLDNRDAMVVSQEGLYPHQRPTPASLNTSFADLMLGDRQLLQKSRDGRLGRCGDNRDRLYTETLLTDSNAATTIANLRDTIIALQLRNSEISLCLQQERRRREEAESIMERERGYIKRLEESIQSLKNTRLVIDPTMYRQIAESYIASRRTPVRRTCSSNLQSNGRYEDLVCDSSPENSLSPSPTSRSLYPELSDLYTTATSSCLSHTTASTSASLNTATTSIQSSPTAYSSSGLPLITPISKCQDLRWPSDKDESSFSSNDHLLQNIGNSSSLQQQSPADRRLL